MQILTVELENVKSYEKATVNFTGGVNAIVGHNGAGKSTTLEAIGFTLFDTLNYNQTEFIRGGAKSARSRVSFVSNADERVYDVERRIGSGAHYFVHDSQLGMRICDGKADVVRFLCQHLQVDTGANLASIFKDAVGVPQGTLTAAFLLNDSDRKRIFEALLRVEEYARVSDKLREPLNLLKSRKSEVAMEISRLQGRLERLPILEAQIAERKHTIKVVQVNLGKSMQELDGVQAVRVGLDAASNEALKAERALADSRTKLQGLQARHQAAEQARLDAEAAQKLVQEHQAGHTAYIEAQRSQEALDARVRQRQQVEARRAKIDTTVALQQEKARTLQKQLDDVAQAEKVVAELQAQVIEQTRLEGELAKARQEQARLDDANKLVAQQQEQLKRLQTRRAELERQLAEVTQVEQRIGATTVQADTRRKTLADERDTLARLKSQADLIKEQSQRLEDVQTTVCPLCEQPLTQDHRSEMLARNNSRLDAMRTNYREASKQVQTLETALQEDEMQLRKWQSDLLKLPRADEAQKLSEEVARVQVQLDQASQQAASFTGAAQQVEATQKALDGLGDPRRSYTVASEKASRRKEFETQLANVQKEVVASLGELAQVQAALANFGDLEAELDAVAKLIKRHEVAYQTVIGNQRQADAYPTRVQQAETLAQELAATQATTTQLERAYTAAAANFDKDAHDQAKSREQELQREVGTLRGQATSLDDAQAKDELELSDLRGLTAAVAESEVKMKRLVDAEDVLDTIRGKLRQAGPYISAALNRQISDGARQIFSDLMADYSRHLTWNEDYSITLEVDGRQRSFSQLSGGEQMSAALSVRLALLREMSSIDVAFFDEPTANLDEVRREALARQILNVRGFRQLFVISHDDTFEQATQNLIRVERVAGSSQVVAG